MKYDLEISGGFANILEKYSGEMQLDEAQKEGLKQLLEKYSEIQIKTNTRDAFVYHFNLTIDNMTYEMDYNDTTLPIEMITLVDAIRKHRKL